jgi:hypothetical protein
MFLSLRFSIFCIIFYCKKEKKRERERERERELHHVISENKVELEP